MNVKVIVIPGLVAGFVSFLVSIFFLMNPLVSGVYSKYRDWPILKTIATFGGLGNWLIFMLIGSLFSTVPLAVLYSYTEKGLGIEYTWKKGLFFGVLFWLVSRIPLSYYIWFRFSYPNILNIIEAINGFVSTIVAGILLAILYEKLKWKYYMKNWKK